MPGVPSGKGCDACVKQKKKCDQIKPACSRCARLQIPCIGSGQQRYKFKHVKAGPFPTQKERRRPSSGSESGSLALSRQSSALRLSRTPSNEVGVILNNFINQLEVKDIRYDLCWAYGNLLKEIPRRLGINGALDASVVALTTVSSDLSQRKRQSEAYAKYGQALTALRNTLNDPVTAQAPETLCAIYLIWVAQSWIGQEAMTSVGHGAGIVQILTTAPYRNSQDSFEKTLLATIAAPVIFESLFNPDVEINPWVKQFVLDMERPILSDEDMRHAKPTAPGRPQMGRTMSCIVRMPTFMHYDPTLLPEIQENYYAIQATSKILRDKYTAANLAVMDNNSLLNYQGLDVSKHLIPLLPQRLACFYQRIYAIYLALEILLNGVLRAYEPDDKQLLDENLFLAQEIVTLARAAERWKPVGAGWIPICLVAAWTGCTDFTMKTEIAQAWQDVWQDMMAQPITLAALSSQEYFDGLRMSALRGRSMYGGHL